MDLLHFIGRPFSGGSTGAGLLRNSLKCPFYRFFCFSSPGMVLPLKVLCYILCLSCYHVNKSSSASAANVWLKFRLSVLIFFFNFLVCYSVGLLSMTFSMYIFYSIA